MDVSRVVHLLISQVAARIFDQLLAENQNRVQGRAKFVRHVREELGLVLGSKRELGCLFFQSAPRLLHFLVLAFDFGVLIGELLGFGRKFFVRLLQFGLARLQFDRQLLRLLQ